MTDEIFRWVIAIAVIIAAGSIAAQGIAVVMLLSAFKKTQVKVHAVIDSTEPIIGSVRGIVDDVKPKIASVTTDVTDIAKIGKEHAVRIGDLVKDASDRAKLQVARVDGAVDDTIDQAYIAGDAVKAAILKPVRQVDGFFAGLRTAISVYTGNHRASVDHATQDEEMFI